jgi:hypothetical protein
MKSLLLFLAAGVSCLAFFGNATMVRASEGVPAVQDDRLQQMVQRINDLADRQEELLREVKQVMASRDQMQPQPGPSLAAQAPSPAPAPETVRPPDPPARANHPMAAKVLQAVRGMVGLVFLGCVVCNVLLAIWIFSDIRKRGEGSGIFVVLALVAGIPAAIIYSLVRIGDKLAAGGK